MSKRQKAARPPKKRASFKGVLWAAGGIFAVLLVMVSPIFEVRQVNVTGNTVVEEAAIRAAVGLDAKANMFAVLSYRAVSALEAMPYIKSAKIVKTYPNTIDIAVVERKVCGYVEFARMNTYLLIDGEGMVLGTQTYLSEKLPVIVGLSFDDFAVGRRLETENKDAFDTVVTLSNLFDKVGLEDVVKVDVSDNRDIHLYIRNVDVFFGGMDDADLKIQTLKVLAAELPPEARGFLHMEDISKDPIFQPLK